MAEKVSLDEFALILIGLIIFVFGGSIFILQQQLIQNVTVNVSLVQKNISISFGVFEISTLNETEILEEKEMMKIERGFFGGRSENLVFFLDYQTPLSLEIKVEDTNLEAPISISINGKKFLTEKIEPGIYSFIIPKNLTKKGSNVILFSTFPPGWKFWMRSVYIVSAKVSAPILKTTKKEITFPLSSKIVSNCSCACLQIYKYQSIDTGNLIIKLNGEEVYNRIPYEKKIEIEIPCELLKTHNLISFETDKEAYYKLFVKMIVSYFQ